jgi:hypothetical protein
MVNFCAVCGCSTRTDIVREHLEDTLRICDVSAMGLFLFRTFIIYLLTHMHQKEKIAPKIEERTMSSL